MSINVNKDVNDVYYRYKMPKLIAKIEGKGNGIKTVIVNMSDIAKALYRKPSYATKFFGFELGAQVKLDERNDRFIVNGCHDGKKLQDLLHCYIKKFVLCQSCSNPETTLFSKKSTLFYTCKACGYSDQIDAVHRLTPYILKNLPETEAEGAQVALTYNDVNVMKNDFDDTWIDDIMLQCLKVNDLERVTSESRNILIFKDYVEELFNKREIILQKNNICKKVEELCLDQAFIFVVMEVIFCNRDTVLNDIELYKGLFQYFTRQGQNKVQDYVLIGMEKILISLNIVSNSCHFLKALYDNDIIEEEAIIKWYNNKSSLIKVDVDMVMIIKKECSKMVQWLQVAEEESDN